MHPIFLIGFMGCGKTTVGRLLAECSGWSFVDVDELICEAEGRTITEIFADAGEAAFRAAESRILADVVSAENTVVATGGGIFSDPDNRRLIAAAGGWSVFLDVAWPVLESRLGPQESTRPLWSSPAKARELFDRRLSDYKHADAVVRIHEDDRPRDVVDTIISLRPELACAI